ncbi:MAG TPA: 50S ribosomal protein L10 [Firmicutes bacterium]|nr:50S ribosomal protein L10 [Bacillota bacterium]
MARPEKEATVAELKAKLRSAQAVVLADYRGLTVKKVTELRRRLRQAGVEYRVVKNTLTSRAAHEADLQDLDQYLTGPTAIAFGTADPVAPAKVLMDFARENKELTVKGGVLEGRVIGFDQIKALAELPSREVLLAQVLAGMQAPLAGMARVLSGTLSGFVYALDAYRRQREAQEA